MTLSTSIFTAALLLAMVLPNNGIGFKSFELDNGYQEQTLIDFSNTSAAAWQIVNDSVMGGISRSTLQLHEDGYALFSGTVSLENNGGFASVRARAQAPADLSDFQGLTVNVLGDGKTYSLRLRTVKNGWLTPYSYEARFMTTEGEWETHRLAYSDFRAVYRGRAVRGNPELNSDAVLEIGFMIQDGQEGEFGLSVRKIGAFKPTG
ncbi:MAG: CIA30 family protein [Balneolaceae bacterium]|nr:CIA30 family protein [Balneolaceae bacterium]